MKNALRTFVSLALLGLAPALSAQAPQQAPQHQPQQQAPQQQPQQPQQPQQAPQNPPPPPEPAPAEPQLPPDQPEPPDGDPIGTDPDSADGPQSPDAADADVDELGDEHRPQLELRIGDGEIYTGDVVTVTLTALAPARDDISVPSEQEVAPFEILDTDVRTEERPDGVLHTFTLELLALEPGEHVLAPFRIRVLTPDGIIGHVETEPLTIRVASVLGNEPNAEPRPATQPVPLLEDDPTLYWVGGALLLILLTALFTWLFARWWRAREKAAAPPPPPRPPEEIALEKLNALRQRRDAMLREGQGVEFVDHVSDAVREYLGHRFSFEGLESTTDEVLARMRKRKLRGVGIEEIAGLLQDCDLVKFAKADFTLEQSELLLSGSFRIVRATTDAMPAQAPDGKPAFEPAPRNAANESAADPEEARWMPKPPAPAPALAEPATMESSEASRELPVTTDAAAEASEGAVAPFPLSEAAEPSAELRPIPDTIPPGTKSAAELAVAAAVAAGEETSPAAVSSAAAASAEAPSAEAGPAGSGPENTSDRPIPDTIPPKAPSRGDDVRSADTLRGLAFDAPKSAEDAVNETAADTLGNDEAKGG